MVWRRLWWMLVAIGVLAGCGGGTLQFPINDNAGAPPEAGTPAAVAVSVPTVLILDASGSMSADDAPGPRIDAAKNAAHQLLATLPDTATIGLQTYGTHTGSEPADKPAGCHDVTTLLPLAPLDRAAITTAIDTLTPSGYTPISLALTTAATQLPTDTTPQAIVLVSDGEDTCDTPPCETATALKTPHPGLTISTVGFKVDGPAADQLHCIAEATGGIFVSAANATQLTTRLLATQNLDTANTSLTATGRGDINLGATLTDIRTHHPDFPDTTPTGTVTITWRDCDYTFTDGTLDAITPHNGGRTIDGLTPGSPVTKATELYGPPLATTPNTDNTTNLTYTADPTTNAAYQMKIEGFNTTNNTTNGTIKTITLCRCKPQDNVATFDGYGPIKIGMTEAEVIAAAGQVLDKQHYYNCTVLAAAPGADWRELSVWIDDATGRVTGINTPLGTMTDRRVGEGSTIDDISAAYGRDATIEREDALGPGTMLKVTPDNPDEGYFIAFSVTEGADTVGQPNIGRAPGSEGCALAPRR